MCGKRKFELHVGRLKPALEFGKTLDESKKNKKVDFYI